MNQEVITSVQGAVGRLRLNRPRAIHALTRPMIDAMTRALLEWRGDPSIKAVLLDHAEGRGFCAGGDIRMLAESAGGDCAEAERFFHAEYRLNHLLFTYTQPVVAFMDGITMGGGVGISMPARFRVATERTVFAMPEAGIGLFPDVGGGWYLSRLPGRAGAWLALTSAKLSGPDTVALGIASHYLGSERLEAVKERLIAYPDSIQSILQVECGRPPAAAITAALPTIEKLFASDCYGEIANAVEADPSAWARDQREALATRSPQALKVALRQLVEGAGMTDFAQNMRNEFRIACHVIRRPDFVEGVRAMMIDKDAPRWDPPSADLVDETLLDSLFAPLAPEREWSPLPELCSQRIAPS